MSMQGGGYPQHGAAPPGFGAPAGGPAPAMASTPHGTPGAPGGGKDKTPKSARTSARTNRNIAIALAVCVAIGLLAFLGGSKGESYFVVRAKQSLPALSPVSASALEAVEVPKNLVEQDAISASDADAAMAKATEGDDAVVGKTPIVPVLQDQQIRPGMFSFDLGSAAPLQDDERLISISADIGRGVAGNLRVGDHVDVLAVDDQSRTGGVILHNAEIIAVQTPSQALEAAAQRQTSEKGRNSSPSDVLPTDPIPGTYVLRVPGDKAVTLAVADSTGALYLVFRSPTATDFGGASITLSEAICANDPSCVPDGSTDDEFDVEQ